VRSTTFLFTTWCTLVAKFRDNLSQTLLDRHEKAVRDAARIPARPPAPRQHCTALGSAPRTVQGCAFPRPPAPRDVLSSAPRHAPAPCTRRIVRTCAAPDHWSACYSPPVHALLPRLAAVHGFNTKVSFTARTWSCAAPPRRLFKGSRPSPHAQPSTPSDAIAATVETSCPLDASATRPSRRLP
jgi:hypothetical protein